MKRFLSIFISVLFVIAPVMGRAETGSFVVQAVIEAAIDTPVLSVPENDTDGDYSVTWSSVTLAGIYQLEESADPGFTSTAQYWPTPATQSFTGKDDSTYYYRVKAWTDTPENGGHSSTWSSSASITVNSGVIVKRINCNGSDLITAQGEIFSADIAYSTVSAMGYVLGGSASVSTDSIAGTEDDALYQSSRYGNLEYRFDLPAGMYNITLKFAETGYSSAGSRVFNVYVHDLDTNNRGIKVLGDFDVCAVAGDSNTAVDRTFSNITVNEGFLKITFEGITNLPAVSAIEVKETPYVIGDIGMSDDAFIDMVEYKAFKWFYDNVSAPYYLVSAWGPHDDYAFMVDTNIAGIGFQMIVYCVAVERGWMTYQEAYNRIKGMFQGINLMKQGEAPYDNPYETYWHYYERLNPTEPLPAQDTVRSIFDNGDFMMGVVFAEEYFKGTEIELLAKQVYESLDWNKFGDYTHPTYSEEMIAVLLGASAPRASCRNNTMIAGFNNASDGLLTTPLYFYQWFDNFYDGREKTPPSGRDDFQYAVNSTLANRQMHITEWQNDPVEYNTYDWDTWGLTAASHDGDYGFAGFYGGDVNPFAAAASMPFTPTESLNAMKHMYYRFYKNGFRSYIGPIWSDMYGFCQTYNIGSTSAGSPFYKSTGNGAFDYGSIVMGLENYRSGFVWNTAMNSDYIKAGLYRIGVSGYDTPLAVNIAENRPVTASSVNGTNTAASAVDDNLITRWESDWSATNQWIYVDLEDTFDIDKVEIYWEEACAKSYKIQTSYDAVTWTNVYAKSSNAGAVNRIIFSTPVNGRYVRVLCTEKALTDYGYSIWGLKVFGTEAGSIDTPVIAVPSTDDDGEYVVSWNSVSGAAIYQLQEDTVDTFDSADNREFWAAGISENITGRTEGVYYYRVKAWTASPQSGGMPSDWSGTESLEVNSGTTLIDNFDDGDDSNLFGGTNGPWGDGVTRSFDAGSLKLDYNIDGWSAFSFGIGSGHNNFTSYTNLTFYIKGTADYYGIAMKDGSNNEVILPINSYIAGVAVTGIYNKVTVPLSAFASVNKSDVIFIWVNFDSGSMSNTVGAVNIEDLALE
ncbi:MAG: malectin domain-containing carbohydrate-binding protein [Elusimicrobiota bacterium]